MIAPLITALALALAPPTPPPPQARDEPIGGGYWAPGERPRPEPPDGRASLIVASVTLPLGIVGVAAFAGGVYVAAPARCQRLTELSAESCKGLYILSWVRVGYGALMAISGAAFLGVGLVRRRRHREWLQRRDFTWGPDLGRRRAGIALSMRF